MSRPPCDRCVESAWEKGSVPGQKMPEKGFLWWRHREARDRGNPRSRRLEQETRIRRRHRSGTAARDIVRSAYTLIVLVRAAF